MPSSRPGVGVFVFVFVFLHCLQWRNAKSTRRLKKKEKQRTTGLLCLGFFLPAGVVGAEVMGAGCWALGAGCWVLRAGAG
jgi:hypothetical protein